MTLATAIRPAARPAVKRVVVLGGGFGGAYAACRLGRVLGARPDVDIVLISDQNYLLFTPMLHEVAAGDLQPPDLVAPLRQVLRQVRFVEGEVTGIDLQERIVRCGTGPLRRPQQFCFDHLLLAPGAVSNFFGMTGVAERASTMKTIADAVLLRNRMVALLEDAATEPDPVMRQSLMTFVVAGGGFAGVETVGAINDFLRDTVRRFPELDPALLRVVLVHSGETVLPELDPSLGRFAQEHLRRRGVELQLGTRVSGYESWAVKLTRGASIPSHTLVWTAGTKPAPIAEALGVEKVQGRLAVNERLELLGHPGVVWAIGDAAAVPDGRGGWHPPTAQHAIRQGHTAAANIAAAVTGRPQRPFVFRTLGQLASLGHYTGVAQIFGVRFSGFFAWWLWRTVYLAKLPGIVRKLRVVVQWTLDLLFPRQIEQMLTRRELAQVQRLAAQVGASEEPPSVGAAPAAVASAQRPLASPSGAGADQSAAGTSVLDSEPIVGRAELQRHGLLDIACLAIAVVEELRRQTGAWHASVWLGVEQAAGPILVASSGRDPGDAEQRLRSAAALPPAHKFAASRPSSVRVRDTGAGHDLAVAVDGGGSTRLEVLLCRSEPFPAGVGAAIERLVEPILAALWKQSRLDRLEGEWVAELTRIEAEIHDLQNPLTSLRLGLHTIRERAAELQDPSMVGMTEGLSVATERVITAVRGLAQQRLATGLHLQVVNPVEIVRSQVRLLGELARAKSIEWQLTLPDQAVAATLDPAWYVRALQNVLDNALKYSPRGAVVTVAGRIDSREFLVQVDDAGAGFAAADWTRLFSPGGVGVTKPTAGEPQTGLGLWIARQAMRAMGGQVWAEPGPRGGARVSLTLPLAGSDPAMPRGSA